MTHPEFTFQSLAALAGQRVASSSWITLDQTRIDLFAECTNDPQWIHVDRERARTDSPFGGTIAHGFLTLSLLAPTAFDALISRMDVRQVVNYGLDKVRFVAPVRAGKRVRNHVSIVSLEDKGHGRHLLTTENSMEIEGEAKPALVAHSMVLLIA
ncbi:MaoC family dehydratase [Variovorax sp. J31P207]|uniref:MaoC family dehydratase n=1 Tax=Variovorax sp. J31P207 TaxID=3053510 RepID=UPI0025791E97|nr:MaoC family dehydratase [Variovorax sp. J31P207]MDM0072594.1 MaoC family dehydratase [Variovorax sp. J31P207]